MDTIYNMLDEWADNFPQGAIFILHSDQGFQYQKSGYQDRLKKMNIIQRMPRKGNSNDMH